MSGALALDVPERLVDAGHRVVQDRPRAPVGADVRGLPDVLDSVGVLADEERAEVLLDGGDDGERTLGEGGAAEAVESGLVGLDLDDHEPDAVGRGADRLDVGNLKRRQTAFGHHVPPLVVTSVCCCWRSGAGYQSSSS